MFLAITDTLSSRSHSLFVILNTIREWGACSLIIHLSSSAISVKENEQRALKEQLSILLAVLIHSEVLRYRTVEALHTYFGIFSIFKNIDYSYRLRTTPLTLTTFSNSTAPT